MSEETTGGVEINLLRSQSQPIVHELGIESSGQITLDEQPADILRPVIPFWSKIDVTCGAIDYQYWRPRPSGFRWTKAGDRVEQ